MKPRSMRIESLESRRLMAADPIHVGVVYLETDYLETDVGQDSQGDRFLVSFTGGAPGTKLTELRIRTDKFGDGISLGDPIFDTEPGGLGKNGSHPFLLTPNQTETGERSRCPMGAKSSSYARSTFKLVTLFRSRSMSTKY